MAKTFGDKVGTPRGYVDRAARDKVDEAMQPVAEVGKQLLFLTPMGRPIRGAKAIYESGKAFLKGSGKQVAKEAVKDTTKATTKAATQATTKAATSRPARNVKPGSARQEVLDSLKQGPKRPTEARDVAQGSMRQKTLDSLKQGPKKPEKAADFNKGGARDAAFKDAKANSRSVTRKPRPGEKKFIGPTNKPQPGDRKFIGPTQKPKPGDKNFIGPRDKPRSGDKDFIGPNPRAAKPGDKNFIGPREKPRSGDKDFIGPNPQAPKPGSKDFVGPMRSSTGARTFGGKMKAGAAAGAGLLGFAAYRSADKPNASSKPSSQSNAPRDDRASSGSSTADAFRKKRQGMNVPGSPTNPNKAGPKKDGPKKAGDKSSAAAKPEKKMSNFERMKKRQYEKEGYGGRSMTSRSAEGRVKKERGFKFKDLFKKK
jgi:hypothetical protein